MTGDQRAGEGGSDSALPKPLWMLIPQQEQRQDSLTHQLRDLHAIAVRCGLYDAANWLERNSVLDD